MLYEVDGRMKYEGCNSSKHTHKEGKDKRKLPVRHFLNAPFYDLINVHYFLITVTSPLPDSLMMLEGT